MTTPGLGLLGPLLSGCRGNSRPGAARFRKTILIGIDEAGYGPHLGPMVVTATACGVGGCARTGEALLVDPKAGKGSTYRAAAASLGMIPIAREVFWGPMAYAMIGGIIVATAWCDQERVLSAEVAA